jgi:hypothetical protein
MTFTLPAPQTDEPMTPEQLHAISRRLGMLSREGLREAYREAHQRCRLDAATPPASSAIHELVIAWRLLRVWYERTELVPGSADPRGA